MKSRRLAPVGELAAECCRRTLRGVILNSGGGNVFEAVKLVDLIRDLDFDTGVTRGGTCASACFMLWAAGKNRYLYDHSRQPFL